MSGRGGPLPWLVFLMALSCGKAEKADEDETTTESAKAACSEYCEGVMSACTGANAVYVTADACRALCALLEPGDPAKATGNTLACRAAQASLAEREPDAHCAAAGPGGNDTCGSDCQAYCAMYPQVCPAEAEAQGTDTCLDQCRMLVDQPSFDVTADHGGDTLECRLVHLSSSVLQPAAHCQHAQLAPTEPWCVPEAQPNRLLGTSAPFVRVEANSADWRSSARPQVPR
jgi:hypothetical protein